jgi:hypothetical protein
MSTCERYTEALKAFVRATGKTPIVAVLGQHDYMTLGAELRVLFGVRLVAPATVPDRLDYHGVAVFEGDMEEGIYFGGAPDAL